MGNCQAIDAAALVIQHPNGRLERLYWTITASEVMKMNPGHYVSLIIPLPSTGEEEEENQNPKKPRFTRVKLLRQNETLALGHAYRLITSQEVINFLKAKKYEKMKKQQGESSSIHEQEVVVRDKQTTSGGGQTRGKCSDKDRTDQVTKPDQHRPRRAPANSAVVRNKLWRPSLQSIAEAGS